MNKSTTVKTTKNTSKNTKNTKKQQSKSLRLLTIKAYSFIMNTVITISERIKQLCRRLQSNILSVPTKFRLRFAKLAKRKDTKDMAKSNKKADKPKTVEKAVAKVEKSSDKGFMFGILGIAIALVIVSIAYSTAVILLGTKGITPKIMLAPQALFGVVVLGMAFSKIFK